MDSPWEKNMKKWIWNVKMNLVNHYLNGYRIAKHQKIWTSKHQNIPSSCHFTNKRFSEGNVSVYFIRLGHNEGSIKKDFNCNFGVPAGKPTVCYWKWLVYSWVSQWQRWFLIGVLLYQRLFPNLWTWPQTSMTTKNLSAWPTSVTKRWKKKIIFFSCLLCMCYPYQSIYSCMTMYDYIRLSCNSSPPHSSHQGSPTMLNSPSQMLVKKKHGFVMFQATLQLCCLHPGWSQRNSWSPHLLYSHLREIHRPLWVCCTLLEKSWNYEK